jgi:Lon protease-like protein
MTELPMFPLGSVLFPAMPMQLRVFEQRYLLMLSRILKADPPEFGVVLIERGTEVGGGEQPFAFGTVAQLTELEGGEGFVGLEARGTRRFEVVEWLEQDAYPCAVVRDVAELTWDDELLALRSQAEHTVRSALAGASEFMDGLWPADVELSDDRIAAAWQLAAIAPLGELDQLTLLRSTSTATLLGSVIDLTHAAGENFDILGS